MLPECVLVIVLVPLDFEIPIGVQVGWWPAAEGDVDGPEYAAAQIDQPAERYEQKAGKKCS
jgi:hypothetical protein